jgi:hypothetical protein
LPPNLRIPPGGHYRFSIGGLAVELTAKLSMEFPVELPGAFASFETDRRQTDLHIVADSRRSIGETRATACYDSGHNWLLRKAEGRTRFESYHPFCRLLVTATESRGFKRYDLLFDEGNWSRLRDLGGHSWFQLPHPLDQLLFLAPLARVGAFLLHAAGAVIDGKAFVFAGHSGDGKTTLSRLLAAEGLPLLSDERIALRKEKIGFRAYGTPWPGEGQIVSPSSYPLAGVFILKKAHRNRALDGRASVLAAELLSRAIVPYYLPRETDSILGLVNDLVTSLPLRELEFSLSGGLLPILARAA